MKQNGYARSSTPAIAAIGGFNPALIFYYFDTLDDLLVAACGIERLLELLAEIYRDDVASGHIRVVPELVGASVSRPDLAGPVVALMEPWLELAENTIARRRRGDAAG